MVGILNRKKLLVEIKITSKHNMTNINNLRELFCINGHPASYKQIIICEKSVGTTELHYSTKKSAKKLEESK